MSIWLWIGFLAFVGLMMAIDLGLFHRESHVISTREAFAWTGVWVTLSLCFTVAVYFIYERHLFGMGTANGQPGTNGIQAATIYITGYIVEMSLSLDNVFVIALIFQYFQIPRKFQHRVLFWGILGAQVLRGALILAGSVLIRQFEWLIYVFGAILIVTAIRMMMAGDEKVEPEHNFLVRIARRFYPVSTTLDGERFFTLVNGKKAMTPLFLVLLMVESTDLLFALDSIPAIFGFTTDPFIIFTSNIFAILGLRSLYFALAAMIESFHYLKSSLVFLLAFVGVKMLVSHVFHIPTSISLAIIAGILAVGVIASLIRSARERRREAMAQVFADESRQSPGD